jgi:hypothetical protein
MKTKKTYSYPSRKNPIILPNSFILGSAYLVKDQLIELEKRKDFQRKDGKIPTL